MDYNLQNIELRNWFPPHIAGRKRKNIQFLLIRLTKEKNPLADSVLKFLPQEDVKIALQDRQSSRTSTSGIKNNESGEIRGEDTTIPSGMEEDSKPDVCPDEEAVEMEVSPAIVYDQMVNNEIEK